MRETDRRSIHVTLAVGCDGRSKWKKKERKNLSFKKCLAIYFSLNMIRIGTAGREGTEPGRGVS